MYVFFEMELYTKMNREREDALVLQAQVQAQIVRIYGGIQGYKVQNSTSAPFQGKTEHHGTISKRSKYLRSFFGIYSVPFTENKT